MFHSMLALKVIKTLIGRTCIEAGCEHVTFLQKAGLVNHKIQSHFLLKPVTNHF